MKHDSTRRRQTIVGLACMTIGSVAIVGGLAAPAGAHEGKEPVPIPETNNLTCAELAEKFGITADWTESKIEAADLPGEGESQTYTISDRGTPGDDSDDATVTIDMVMELKNFNWSSNVGIDAIYVKGGSAGSYFYGYQPDVNEEGDIVGDGEEAMSDIDLGTPPWKEAGKNQISHVTFCWDDEPAPTTSSSTTEPTETTECPDVVLQSNSYDDKDDEHPTTTKPDECETTTTSDTTPEETTSSIDLGSTTTLLSSATTTTPVSLQSELPETGSNSTLPMILGGLGLLALGGGLVAGNKWLRRA
jgi:LPXTG-motif cell wall-anchored protein